MLKFHFVNVVWGESYIRLFLDVVLPNQLAPGNLGAFAGDRESRYRIYTTPDDSKVLQAAHAFQQLKATLAVEVELIEPSLIDPSNPYGCLSACHRDAVRAAARHDAALVFLAPDFICADGTMSRLRELAAAGCQAVLIGPPRVVKERFVPDLLATAKQPDGTIAIRPRRLVELALRHPHPVTRSQIWDADRFSLWPSHLYWPVGKTGMLERCFHLHPLFINTRHLDSTFDSTIDDDLVERACTNKAAIHVVDDSDEIAGCEISSVDAFAGLLGSTGASVPTVASWMVNFTNRKHRQYVRRKIRFHATDLDDAWRDVDQASDRIVNSIFSAYRKTLVRHYAERSKLGPIARKLGLGRIRRGLRSISSRRY